MQLPPELANLYKSSFYEVGTKDIKLIDNGSQLFMVFQLPLKLLYSRKNFTWHKFLAISPVIPDIENLTSVILPIKNVAR